jgi:hypothetical protein
MESFDKLILFFSFVLLAVSVETTTYYVSTSGSDANPGTQAAPFRTICHGIRSMNSGDKLEIAGGTYTEWISGQNDCSIPPGISDTQRTVIRGAPGERVIIQPPSGSPFVIELWRHPYTDSGAPQTFITIDGLILDGTNIWNMAVRTYQEVQFFRITNTEIKNIRNQLCTQAGSGCGGMLVTGAYNYFANLSIHDLGVAGSDWGFGIYLSGANNLFENLIIHDIYGSGIQFWNQLGPTSDDNVIRNSRIYNTRQMVCEVSAMYHHC